MVGRGCRKKVQGNCKVADGKYQESVKILWLPNKALLISEGGKNDFSVIYFLKMSILV